MERFGPTFGRAAAEVARAALVAAIVAGFLVGVHATDWSAPWWIGAALLLIAAGVVADRPWVAAVPVVVMVGYAAVTVDDGSPGDLGTEGVIALLFSIGSGMGFCALIGVAIRRLWRSRDEPAREPVSGATSRARATGWR